MKVIAKSLIKHNGAYYQKGEEIPGLTETEIAKLLAADSAEVVDGHVDPEPPTDPTTVPSDKTAETKGTEEVANLPIAMTMTKEKLIGIARANGLPAEKTTTREEAYKMIKEYREANNIVIEDKDPANKPKAKNPQAPKKEDKENAAPGGENGKAGEGEGQAKGGDDTKTGGNN